MTVVPGRCDPTCCASCESRTVKRHCKSGRCRWVVCQKCGATTGIIARFEGVGFTGWYRASFVRPRPVV